MIKARVAPSTPVVFLHAFPLNARMWDAQRARLPGRPVLTPDFPGFGGRPPGPTTLDGFAEGVISEMDGAAIDRAVFVGLSMGGYVAFRIHARWPERVAALVLADTRAGPDTEVAARRRTDQANRVRQEGVAWMPDALIPTLLGASTRSTRPEVVREVRDMILDADPEGVALALIAMRERRDSRPDLPGIAVPVLAVVGEEDTLTTSEEVRQIADSVPDSELVVLPGAGHLSNLENPSAFDAALMDFLG